VKVRVATLNLLFDDWLRWPRLNLVIDEIKSLKPSVILLQEVSLKAGVAERLARELPEFNISLCPRTGKSANLAQAILSRKKPLATDWLELSQQRVAQKVMLEFGGHKICFINVHAHFSLLRDKPRATQIRQILRFADSPAIIAGDFNALPGATSLQPLEKRFASAYKKVHGSEPAMTGPSPLWRGPGLRQGVRRAALKFYSGGTLDYIFVEKSLRVTDCQLAFNKASPLNPVLYPSDHFGLVADIFCP